MFAGRDGRPLKRRDVRRNFASSRADSAPQHVTVLPGQPTITSRHVVELTRRQQFRYLLTAGPDRRSSAPGGRQSDRHSQQFGSALA